MIETRTDEALRMIKEFADVVRSSDTYGAALVLLTKDGQISAETNLDCYEAHTVFAFLANLQLQAIEEVQH